MSPDEPSGPRPAPIVLRIKLRYDDVEVMVQRFATNVGKSGLFLPTRSLQPIGAEIKFELRLSDDTPVLVGLGRVKAVHAPDPKHPRATFGIAIELSRVTPQSRALILRMLERRRQLGLPDTALPTAAEIDSARRAETAEPVAREPASAPPAVVTPAVVAPAVAPGDALLTSPRRPTGPMAAARPLGPHGFALVAPLPPEPPRTKRTPLSELLGTASGRIASAAVAVPGLDDQVDVAGAMARARTLAGGALDADLEALCDAAAVPLEISVEGASAELAHKLGGHAVRRDRSASEAEPVPALRASDADGEAAPASAGEREEPEEVAAVPEAAAAGEPSADAAAEAAAEHETLAEAAAPPLEVPAEATADHGGRQAAAPEHETDAVAAAVPAVPQAPFERLDSVELAVDAALDAILLGSPGPAPEPPAQLDAPPPQIAQIVSPLDELGMDDAEHTELGDIPLADGTAEHGDPAASHDDLAASSVAHETSLEANTDSLRELTPAPDDPGAGSAYDERAGARPGSISDEFEDFEILAEADAADEDLLTSHGQRELSAPGPRAASPAPDRRPSELDFAARLDLGDDSDASFALPEAEHAQAGRRDEPELDSAVRALAAFALEDDRDEPGAPLAPAQAPAVRARASQPTRPPVPASRRGSPPAALRVDDDDLEHALEVLDVDLDDLSRPRQAPARPRPVELPRPRPVRPVPAPAHRVDRHVVPRPSADDAAVIDLDDDD